MSDYSNKNGSYYLKMNEQTPAITQEIIFNPSTPEEAELADQGATASKEFFRFAIKQKGCAGLAANQVCYEPDKRLPFRMLMYKIHKIPTLAMNPEIIGQSGRKNLYQEGCLTWPMKKIVARRYDKIVVRYTDTEGIRVRKNLKGKEAQIYQHEMDHLNGVEELFHGSAESFAKYGNYATGEYFP